MTDFAVWAKTITFLEEISGETEPSRGKKSSFGIFDAGAQHFGLFWHQQVGETTIDELNDTKGRTQFGAIGQA